MRGRGGEGGRSFRRLACFSRPAGGLAAVDELVQVRLVTLPEHELLERQAVGVRRGSVLEGSARDTGHELLPLLASQ
jgi:hypothetical protein